jgi:hypothetical protein
MQGNAKKRRTRGGRHDDTDDEDGGGGMGGDGDEDPHKTRKAALLSLFTLSGAAKVDSVLTHVGEFLSDPLSGKVRTQHHRRHKKTEATHDDAHVPLIL